MFHAFVDREIRDDYIYFQKKYSVDKIQSDLFKYVLHLFNSPTVVDCNKLDSFFFVKKYINMVWHDNEVLALNNGINCVPYANKVSTYLKMFQSDFLYSRSYFDIFVKLMECYSVGTVNDLLKCLQLKKPFKKKSDLCVSSIDSNTNYIMYNVHSKFEKPNTIVSNLVGRKKVKKNVLHKSFSFNNNFYKILCHKYSAVFIEPTSNKLDFALAGSIANFSNVKDKKQLQSWLNVILPRLSFMFASAFILNPAYFVELNDILLRNNFTYCDQMLCVGEINDTLLNSNLNCYGENVFFFRSAQVRWNSSTKQQFSNFSVFNVNSNDCYDKCLFEFIANIVDFIITKNEGENVGRVYFDSNCSANSWKRPKNWNFYLLDS